MEYFGIAIITFPICLYLAGIVSEVAGMLMLISPTRYINLLSKKVDVSAISSVSPTMIRCVGIFNAIIGEFIVRASFPWMVSAIQQGMNMVSTLLGSISF